MSTHAIVWFHDDDILGIYDAAEVTKEAKCERRWERIKIDIRVRVTYTVGKEIEAVDAQGNDVSEGGMGTYIPAELKQGDSVVVEVVRRYGQPRISFSAKVSNRNGFRYGLEFVGVEDEQRASLVSSITGTAN